MKNLDNLFKLNLASLILILVCIALGAVSITQWSSKNNYKKALEQSSDRYLQWEDETILKHEAEVDVYKDSIEYYKEQYEISKAKAIESSNKVIEIKAKYNVFVSEAIEIPSDTVYALLMDSYKQDGALEYPFAGNQIKEIYLDIEEGKICTKINEEITKGNTYILESLEQSGNINIAMQKQKDILDTQISEMQSQLAIQTIEKKEFKKKLWTNRIIAGGAVALLVVAIL